MGRKPMSSAVAKQKGSYINQPGRENKDEPKPPKGWPTMPETVGVDPLAVKKWNETCELLDEMNVLSRADETLLELFCINHSQYIALLKKVREQGIIAEMVNHRGETILKRSPYQSEFARIADRQVRILAEFGLTPSSRTRVAAIRDTKTESSFDKWLDRGGLN